MVSADVFAFPSLLSSRELHTAEGRLLLQEGARHHVEMRPDGNRRREIAVVLAVLPQLLDGRLAVVLAKLQGDAAIRDGAAEEDVACDDGGGRAFAELVDERELPEQVAVLGCETGEALAGEEDKLAVLSLAERDGRRIAR